MKKGLFFICIFSLAFLMGAAEILVIDGVHWEKGIGDWEIGYRARRMKTLLQTSGIEFTEVQGDCLDEVSLKGKKLAIIPCSGPLNNDAIKALTNFVEQGGKLMVFCSQDTHLLALLDIEDTQCVKPEKLGIVSGVNLNEKSWEGAPVYFRQSSTVVYEPVLSADCSSVVVGQYRREDGTVDFIASVKGANGVYFSSCFLDQDMDNGRRALISCMAQWVPSIMSGQVEKAAGQLERSLVMDGGTRKWKLNPAAQKKLSEALHLQKEAGQKGIEPIRAYGLLTDANKMVREVYAETVPSRPGELRGVWIHDPRGIPGWGWDKTIKVLAENGFNAIFPNLGWSAVADYRSDVLPVHPDVEKNKVDYLQQCIDACRKYGVEIHVWKVAWNMGNHTPESVRKKMREAGRTQLQANGMLSDFLAPHQLLNVDMEVAAWLEIARKYDIDGLHLDYIRYPDAPADFSDSAREDFEKFIGYKVENWPEDCMDNGSEQSHFNEWRRSNVTRLVRRLSRELKLVAPNVRLSAAVYGNWPNACEKVAQDARAWIKQGYLDFVCPMNYEPQMKDFLHWCREQNTAINGKVPFYAGIGSYLLQDGTESIRQALAAREFDTGGFVLFQLTPTVAENVLPLMKKGLTAVPSPGLPHNQRKIRTILPSDEDEKLPRLLKANDKVEMDMAIPAKSNLGSVKYVLWRNGQQQVTNKGRMTRTADGIHLAVRPSSAGYYRWEVTGKDNQGNHWQLWSQPFVLLWKSAQK